MENLAVKLGYLSKTQNNAKKKDPQNNQPEALHMLFRKNKLPQMKNTSQLKPVLLILTSDGLYIHHHACLGSLSFYSWLSMHASQEKKQVKSTSQDLNSSTKTDRVTMSVHDFKCNDDTTAYHKDEHQNRSVGSNGIKLRFMSVNDIFIILQRSEKKSYDPSYPPICLNYICHLFCIIWCKFSFPYCLWLYCLCLGPPRIRHDERNHDERKGNTSTNSKGKKISTISNKQVGECRSDMLPIYISAPI